MYHNLVDHAMPFWVGISTPTSDTRAPSMGWADSHCLYHLRRPFFPFLCVPVVLSCAQFVVCRRACIYSDARYVFMIAAYITTRIAFLCNAIGAVEWVCPQEHGG